MGAVASACDPFVNAAEPIPLTGKIQIGDLLEIASSDLNGPNTELLQRVRVAPDGTAGVFWVTPVKLAGLTTEEAGHAIRDAYIHDFVEFGRWINVERIEAGDHPSVRPGPAAAGDLIQIMIFGLSGPGDADPHCLRIDEDGTIALPYLGLLHVAGLDERGIEREISKAYRDANLIQHAVVGVLKVQDADRSQVKQGPVGRGDLLRITTDFEIQSRKEITFDVRVGADGRIAPLGLNPLPVSGMTVAQVTVAIGKAIAGPGKPIHDMVWLLKLESGDHPSMPLGSVGVGDAVSVVIENLFGHDGWTHVTRVSEEGSIHLPYIGQVKIVALTESQAVLAIKNAYNKQSDPHEPAIRVSLLRVAADKPVGPGSR
jgi:protein involved in polysaccharide export with SLBB domain